MNDPVRFAPRFVDNNRAVASADGEVRAVMMQLQEIPNDSLFLVPERNDELVHSIDGVVLHNVPKDRLAADFYHWLRAGLGFFGEPRPHSAGQNCNLHQPTHPDLNRIAVCLWSLSSIASSCGCYITCS